MHLFLVYHPPELKLWYSRSMREKCISESCEFPAISRGYCNIHYQRLRKSGELKPKHKTADRPICSESQCERAVKTRGLCNAHYQSKRSDGSLPMSIRSEMPRTAPDGSPIPCSVSYCDNPVASRGKCDPHYRQERAGKPLTPVNEMVPCPTPSCGRGKSYPAKMCTRCRQFKARYSLSEEQFDSLMSRQICSNPGCGSASDLHLDHDHSCCSEKAKSAVSCGLCVRGWLCRECNWALGQLKENPRRIGGLLEYLNGFKP